MWSSWDRGPHGWPRPSALSYPLHLLPRPEYEKDLPQPPSCQAGPACRPQRSQLLQRAAGRALVNSHPGPWEDRALSVSLRQQAREAGVGSGSKGLPQFQLCAVKSTIQAES